MYLSMRALWSIWDCTWNTVGVSCMSFHPASRAIWMNEWIDRHIFIEYSFQRRSIDAFAWPVLWWTGYPCPTKFRHPANWNVHLDPWGRVSRLRWHRENRLVQMQTSILLFGDGSMLYVQPSPHLLVSPIGTSNLFYCVRYGLVLAIFVLTAPVRCPSWCYCRCALRRAPLELSHAA